MTGPSWGRKVPVTVFKKKPDNHLSECGRGDLGDKLGDGGGS